MPVRLWKPDAGKFYFEVIEAGYNNGDWKEVDIGQMLNGGPSFIIQPPEGFQAWEAGDTIHTAIDWKAGKAFFRVSNGDET